MTGVQATTPLRSLVDHDEHGCTVLSDGVSDYADGAEDIVTALLENAQDRGSLSDELTLAARTWPERYHLDHGRANVLRGLRLPAGATVLEIGCGTGAVTRYLAESCGSVDAVEPVLSRARGARARTRGFGDVEVFVGGIEDVPAAEAYDVVIVVGVLEYVGAGGAADDPYVSFLRAAHARLRPGGTLVLAIENQLGVKYLCGAAEDHTGIPWDGVAGYPAGGVARTFSRKRLLDLVGRAGFAGSTVLGAFPDYKLTRALLSDELLTTQPRLATQLPGFPSPDWAGGGNRVVDEQRVWHELVDAGLAAHHSNSFLVLAAKDGAEGLWPAGALAVFFSTDRAADFCTRSVVERDGDVLRVRRTPLAAHPGAAHGVRIVSTVDEVFDAPTVLELAEADPARWTELFAGWRDLVVARAAELGPRLWDLTPQNLLVTPSGLEPIDLEWSVDGCTAADVLARGVLITADELARGGHAPGPTVGDVVRDLCHRLELDEAAVLEATAVEARFQVVRQAGRCDAGYLAERTTELRQAWTDRLAEPVAG
ncbi:SAM-dependent methyltransferase [Amycolatopsis sp. NPDC101161]|uniref:SAM-dependent methyltransferase n=1 Tax=Amycolatopsis sp. NPDC101161 TaxID=3363940 RepID=UPI00380ED10C